MTYPFPGGASCDFCGAPLPGHDTHSVPLTQLLIASPLNMVNTPSETGPADEASKGVPNVPIIPPALYVKANVHQDQLTPEERSLLLSRGDLVGQALAHPDSLTPDQVHELLGMPHPDVMRARIQRASRGKLTTVDELYAKAKRHPPSESGRRSGRAGARLTDAEDDLLSYQFRTDDEYQALAQERWKADYARGVELAVSLVALRLGWHIQADPVVWPPTITPRSPMLLYGQDARISGQDVYVEWDALPDGLKEAYRAGCEKFRIEAWVRFETALAEGRRPAPPFTPEEMGPPLDDPGRPLSSGWFDHVVSDRSYVTTGLKLFGEGLLADPRAKVATASSVYLEVERRWIALTAAQRGEYEAKAAEANSAVRAGYWARAAEACAAAEAAHKEGSWTWRCVSETG